MFRYPFEGLLKSNLDNLPESEAALVQENLERYDVSASV
jgi:hypothetical protein